MSAAVNGTYSRTGTYFSGAPRFAMNGVWDGAAVTFDMYLLSDSWNISILSGAEPGMGEDSDIDFYYADVETHPLVPPSTGWMDADTEESDPELEVKCYYNTGVFRVKPVSNIA